jgi:hypothetical protein
VGGGSRQRRLAIVGKVVVMLVDQESLLVAFLPFKHSLAFILNDASPVRFAHTK